jgi:biotin carboxylase
MKHGEFSVESLSFSGRHYPIAVTEKRVLSSEMPVEIGHIVPASFSETSNEHFQMVAGVLSDVLSAVGIEWGVTHSEFMCTPDGVTVVEIHLRPAGDRIVDLVYYATGINLYDLLYRLALGEQFEEKWLQKTRSHAAMISFFDFCPGTVTDLSELRRFAGRRGLIDMKVDLKPYQEIRPVRSYFQRYGHLICTAESVSMVDALNTELANEVETTLVRKS